MSEPVTVWVALLALCLLGGCSGDASPGEGSLVAGLATGQVIGVSVDEDDVCVALLEGGDASLHIAVSRVRGSQVTDMPLAATDWSDYTMGSLPGLGPAKTVQVSGGQAYFLGFFGVTVVPLDGTPSRILYQPRPGTPAGLEHAFNALGAFTVDDGTVYVCFNDTEGDTNPPNRQFGRFRRDGTWELLFSSPTPETCFGGAVTADANAVYWSSDGALRSWNKSTGAVSTVVDFAGGASEPPSLLAVSGMSLVWFDYVRAGFCAANKSASTRLDAVTALVTFQPTDSMPLSLAAMNDRVFWLTMGELRDVPTVGGGTELLARRDSPPGRFMGLAVRGSTLFFSDADGSTSTSDVVLRSVR